MALSSGTLVNELPRNNSNNIVPSIDSKNLSQIYKNLENNLPLNLPGSESLKNVIFQYTSSADQKTILNYVSKNGILVNNLNKLPFILAKIPENEYTYLKNNNVNVFLDKEIQVLPNITSSISASSQITSYQKPIDQIQGESLIKQGYLGQGITIAVIDSGINDTHPDLANKVINHYNFVLAKYGFPQSEPDSSDGNGHGTHVAGLAVGSGAGVSGNPYIGVAPDANVYNLKVVNFEGFATESAIIMAIDYAINLEVNIITMSLGFSGSSPNDPVALALDIAVNTYGIVATVSAGNSGPGIGTVATPGAARSVITVGASYNENDSATFFSSRGPNSDYRYDPDILAPGWYEISALAQGSLIYSSEKYYSPSLIVPNTNDLYAALSGTSMAAPITAGAVALLLSKYPNLTPQGVRAALMTTATNTGQPEYVQGAGFLNVTKASELINQTYSSSPSSKIINAISLLPQRSIFPNSPVLYPGDNIKVNLQFVSGNASNIGIVIKNSTIANLISYNKSDTYLQKETSGGYYGELLLTFTVPLNPKPGIFETNFTVTTDSKNFTLELGPIIVKIPTKQIAWNIWYQTDSTDTPSANYASLGTYLENKGIHLAVVNEPVSLSWIYQYNAIVFPDNELAISPSQITILKNYINNGGNVIIISSFYPFSDIENYNKLTTSYGITVLNVTDMNIYDAGIGQYPDFMHESMQLQNVSSLQFNQNTTLNWNGGTYLSTTGQSSAFGRLTNGSTVMAGFFGNSTVKGKLFVLGTEYWLYNEFFGPNEEQFANSLFNYAVNDSSPFINIYQSSSEVKNGTSWSAGIFVGTKGFDIVSKPNVSLMLPNNTVININSSLLYYQLGANLTYVPNQIGTYKLTVEYNKKTVSTTFNVYDTNVGYNLALIPNASQQEPYYLSGSGIPSINIGQSLSIGVLTNQSISNVNISVEITLVPELYNQLSGYIPLTNALYSQHIQLVSQNSTYFTANFQTNNNFSEGFYVVEVLFTSSRYSFQGSVYGEFFLVTPDPVINKQTTTINGKAVSNYNYSIGQYIKINTGQKFDFTIVGSLTNGIGDAFVVFIPLYPFIESQEIIDAWQIPKVSSNTFQGSITIPKNDSLFNGVQTLNYGYGLWTGLLLILRDNQGNYDQYVIFTMVQKQSVFANLPIDQVMIFFIFVVIPGVIVIIYYIKSKNKRSQDSYNYNYNNYQFGQSPQRYTQGPPVYNNQQSYQAEEELRFCPHCGSSIAFGSNFCMECGKKIQ